MSEPSELTDEYLDRLQAAYSGLTERDAAFLVNCAGRVVHTLIAEVRRLRGELLHAGRDGIAAGIIVGHLTVTD